MTTRASVPRLDRQISHEVTTTVEVPASKTYVFNTEELSTDRIDDGGWRRDSDTELAIGLNDSNGVSFPDLFPPLTDAEVAFDGATATILTLTGFAFIRNPFGQLLGILLTFDDVLPAAGTALSLMVPTGGTQSVTQTAHTGAMGRRGKTSAGKTSARYSRAA